MTDLESAREAYRAFLQSRAAAMTRHSKLSSHLGKLQSDLEAADGELESLVSAKQALMRQLITGSAAEADLIALEKRIATAQSTRDRRKDILSQAEHDLRELAIPATGDGKPLLEDYCAASARDMAVRHRRKLDECRALLTEISGAACFLRLGDWPGFLAEFLPPPSDEEFGAAYAKCAEQLEALEGSVQ